MAQNFDSLFPNYYHQFINQIEIIKFKSQGKNNAP